MGLIPGLIPSSESFSSYSVLMLMVWGSGVCPAEVGRLGIGSLWPPWNASRGGGLGEHRRDPGQCIPSAGEPRLARPGRGEQLHRATHTVTPPTTTTKACLMKLGVSVHCQPNASPLQQRDGARECVQRRRRRRRPGRRADMDKGECVHQEEQRSETE